MSQLRIILRSAGIKGPHFPEWWSHKKHDLLLDCRMVPDPSKHVYGTGDNQRIQEWVDDNAGDEVNTLFRMLLQGVAVIPARRVEQADPFEEPFEVLCFCAHGIHRSRAVKHILAKTASKYWPEATVEVW